MWGKLAPLFSGFPRHVALAQKTLPLSMHVSDYPVQRTTSRKHVKPQRLYHHTPPIIIQPCLGTHEITGPNCVVVKPVLFQVLDPSSVNCRHYNNLVNSFLDSPYFLNIYNNLSRNGTVLKELQYWLNLTTPVDLNTLTCIEETVLAMVSWILFLISVGWKPFLKWSCTKFSKMRLKTREL